MLSCFCQKPRRKSKSILAKLFRWLCIITDILSSTKHFLAIWIFTFNVSLNSLAPMFPFFLSFFFFFFCEIRLNVFTAFRKKQSIAFIRYIKILTWLRGFRVKIAFFLRLHYLAIPRRDLSTKKTKPNIEKWPESLGVIIEFKYIKRGLLKRYCFRKNRG